MGRRTARSKVASFAALVAVATSLVIPLTAQLAAAATRNVPANFPTIQAGIDAAVNGDTVLVAPGTYNQRIDFNGKNITVVSSGGPDATVIDGGFGGTVVTFDSAEGPSAILQGFTIRNGSVFGNCGGGVRIAFASPKVLDNVIISNDADCGGGISTVGGSPTIQGNVVASNFGEASGGGIQVTNAVAGTISSNLIAGNVAAGGGGVHVSGGTAVVESNVILQNFVYDQDSDVGGGGIYAGSGADVDIIGNQIEGNEICVTDPGCTTFGFALAKGGGISVSDTDSGLYTIRDNLISGNIGAGDGGGIYSDADSVLVNNLVIGNTSSTFSGAGVTVATNHLKTSHVVNNTVTVGIANQDGLKVTTGSPATAFAYNNIVVGPFRCIGTPQFVSNNASSYTGNCAQGGTNISLPPQFRNEAAGVYALKDTSPSRNTGTNAAPQLPPFDITGRARVLEGTVDQGAFEFVLPKGLPEEVVWEPALEVHRKDLPTVFTSSATALAEASSRTAQAAATPEPTTVVRSRTTVFTTVQVPDTLPDRQLAVQLTKLRGDDPHLN